MIEVWREGFYTQGASENSPAFHFGTFDTDNWEEAVAQAIATHPTSSYLFKQRPHWTWFGCRLYDNEEDARRSFG